MGEQMATQLATQVINTTQVSEGKLIRARQRGDAQAIETLFRRYHRPLFQTALRVLGNAEDRPAVSLDETHHEDELPAAERFADDSPNPEQLYAGTEIREMINENL